MIFSRVAELGAWRSDEKFRTGAWGETGPIAIAPAKSSGSDRLTRRGQECRIWIWRRQLRVMTAKALAVESVFDLLGRDENDLTAALGFTLARSPTFMTSAATPHLAIGG